MEPQSRLYDMTVGICDHNLRCCPHACIGVRCTGSPDMYTNARSTSRLTDLAFHSCFHPTSPVFSNGHIRQIRKVYENTIVISRNRFNSTVKKVSKKMYSGDIIQIEAQGCLWPLKVTPDHNVLVTKQFEETADWKLAKDITIADFLYIPTSFGRGIFSKDDYNNGFSQGRRIFNHGSISIPDGFANKCNSWAYGFICGYYHAYSLENVSSSNMVVVDSESFVNDFSMLLLLNGYLPTVGISGKRYFIHWFGTHEVTREKSLAAKIDSISTFPYTGHVYDIEVDSLTHDFSSPWIVSNCPHCSINMAIQGSGLSYINGLPSHRMADMVTEFCGVGMTVSGAPDTFIGG